jgi:hypothetical protein
VDPITLAILIGAGAAAAAGATAGVFPIWRRVRLGRARELVTRPIIGAQAGSDAPRSVFDVFRDLGSTEYALEVMRHMGLIPETEAELELVAGSLSDAIASYGGYDLMIESLRETIQDLTEDQGKDPSEILSRRLTLSAPHQTEALLPSVDRPGGAALPAPEEVKRLEARTRSSREGGGTGAGSGGAQPHLHATVEEALDELFNSDRSPDAGTLEQGAGGVAAIVIGGVLGSLTTGGFWDGVSRFVHRRRVKQMRSRLNQELLGLSLDLFHAPQPIGQQVERNLALVVQERRWVVERRRREVSRHRKLPAKQRSHAQIALRMLASREAQEALAGAERDTRKLLAQITRHRRSGRHDLAGFLIYVNRKDLLHGISAFDGRIKAIEEAGELLRQALLAEIEAPPGVADGGGDGGGAGGGGVP